MSSVFARAASWAILLDGVFASVARLRIDRAPLNRDLEHAGLSPRDFSVKL